MTTETAAALRTCRIIYYGPAGTGKRDNLLHIANSIPREHRLPVASADTEREIAFLLRSGPQGDWRVSVQAVDTGYEDQIFQEGAEPPFDGVVFVAHSAASLLDQTLSSLEALKSFLDRWGRDITSMPMILQYNLRASESTLPVDQLESLLNPWGLLSFPANSHLGEGVKETLKAVLSLTISHVVRREQATAAARPSDTSRQAAAGEGPRPTLAARPGAPVAPAKSASTPAGQGRPAADSRRQGSPGPLQVQPPVADPLAGGHVGDAPLTVTSEDRGGIFFDELRPPIVVPVRIPKRLLEKYGSARIILEVEVDEGEGMLV